MPTQKQNKDESFESVIERLGKLVNSMEAGEVPLDALVEKYEEGSTLLKKAQEHLKAAELKISQLKSDNQSLEPFA